MGRGIAQVAALAGDRVLLADRDAALAERGRELIGAQLARAVERGKLSAEQREAALARIEPLAALAPVEVSVAIEAASEDPALKLDLFRKLDAATPPTAILASNTSSISITRLAAATARPERVIGMHYFNPVPVMKLVEIVRGLATSQATFDEIRALAIAHGKTPVEVHNFPGFVSNRVLCPMLNEAIFALYEGVGSAEAIDTVMKLGMNHPMGPLELADFIGLDTLLAILRVLHDGFGDPKYRPCPLLIEYVEAGRLGRKSGQGFYDYRGDRARHGVGAAPA